MSATDIPRSPQIGQCAKPARAQYSFVKKIRVMRQAKKFDCVKMMRDIRDRIDAETAGMTYEELRTYLDKK
jgi:hypothetical protein